MRDPQRWWDFSFRHFTMLRRPWGLDAREDETGNYAALFGRDSLWMLIFLLDTAELVADPIFRDWVREACKDALAALAAHQYGETACRCAGLDPGPSSCLDRPLAAGGNIKGKVRSGVLVRRPVDLCSRARRCQETLPGRRLECWPCPVDRDRRSRSRATRCPDPPRRGMLFRMGGCGRPGFRRHATIPCRIITARFGRTTTR
jgi:hypothetical protein